MIEFPIMQAPDITPESVSFWKAAGEQKLLIGSCGSCGKMHWYPRAVCPFCSSLETGLYEASGRGTIYSCSLVSPAKNPYVIAFVTLEEGPTMMTNIFAENLDLIAIGQNVKLAFAPAERNMRIPVFIVDSE